MNVINLTASQLRAAADLKEKIAGLEQQLNQLLDSEPAVKGKISAAGKAKIAHAQKARWAKIKAAKSSVKAVAEPVAKKKFKMSAAAKAKISAAAKARWAKIKAGKK
jgi:hypothetical protein